jgi:uncharacterized protein YdaU (DUF1376 family)
VNYYPFHIGDYLSATRHLSWEEDAAYRRLLDTYYTTEKALPAELRAVCRLVLAVTESQREAVEVVLVEFFLLTSEGWINNRANAEIDAMRGRQHKARDKANKRWHKPEPEPSIAALDKPAMPQDVLENAAASVDDAVADAAASIPDAVALLPTPVPVPVIKTKTGAKSAAPSVLVSIDEIVSEGAEYTHARDWLAYRKSKGHALTPTAWAQTKAQAVKAKLTIAQVVEMLAGSQWMGFRADWILNPASNPGGYRSPASPTATVPSNVADETSAYLEAQANRGAVRPPSEVLAALNKLTAKVVVDATDPVSQ